MAQVAAGIRNHFLEIQERREREKIEAERHHAQWLIQMQEWERKEAIRLQQEKELKHAEAITAAQAARKTALLRFAAKWRQSNTLLEFIGACQARWKDQTGEPTPEQIAWLKWAGEIADALSPFSVSYPDPARDGAFDSNSIPFGGPYPLTRRFK